MEQQRGRVSPWDGSAWIVAGRRPPMLFWGLWSLVSVAACAEPVDDTGFQRPDEDSPTPPQVYHIKDTPTPIPETPTPLLVSCPAVYEGPVAEIASDCSSCDGDGVDLENMSCAIGLCDSTALLDQTYSSPDGALTQYTHAAVHWLGEHSNDLEPLQGDSYAVMATGVALGTAHSNSQGGMGAVDPFSTSEDGMMDVMEWRLHLKAPSTAHGFEVSYVFLSEEYDEFVGSSFNDKFYILIEAESTKGGAPTVINFTECRDPSGYADFTCASTNCVCTQGTSYCYIAINTALSECCWIGGCPQGTATTDITGTGFSCATDHDSDGPETGSSTGWLVTQWPIEPDEEFDLVFHIHDTSDPFFDSEVILDRFRFMTGVRPGTDPIGG